ncbi:leucine-rich repeat protein [Bacteroides heparinolyticus]|uniref:leucine-rich repeat protein n=1 Tax=Prevotella heparinolytica TaxID=28113 RepID=UPI00359FBD0D
MKKIGIYYGSSTGMTEGLQEKLGISKMINMNSNFWVRRLVLLLIFPLFMISCGDKSQNTPQPPQPEKPVGTQNVELKVGDAKSDFAYFSFATNKIVSLSNEEAKTSKKWDIAFSGLNGRSNSGTSGEGNAAVFHTDTEDFDGILNASPYIEQSSHWVVDAYQEVTSYKKMPPGKVRGAFNKALVGSWYTFDLSSMPPKINVSKDVYIVRTALGDYVKLQFVSATFSGLMPTIEFKFAYIGTEGTNTATPKLRDGEVRVANLIAGGLEEALKDQVANKIKILTIQSGNIKQKDLNYVTNKLTALEEIDLTDATFNLDVYENCFKDNNTLKKVIAPKNLRETGFGWFSYMSQVEEIIFPGNALHKIGGCAMNPKLKKVVVPQSVEVMDEQCFMASGIESFVVPEKVTIVPSNAFALCRNLKEVTFPKGLIQLGGYALYYCDKLEKAIFMGSVPPSYGEISPFGNNTWEKDGKEYCRIYVPKGALKDYLEKWEKSLASYFKEI